MSPRPASAVDLITGFLGAGKTTFIRQYAAYLKRRGESYAIIENEYGAAGIDAESLTDTGAVIKEISGGCICCTLKVGFHGLVSGLCEEFDRIIIEPSGVFDPQVYADLLSSPSLVGRICAGMAVAVVDPLSIKSLSPEDIELLRSEVSPSGIALLSKTQLCTEDQTRYAMQLLREMVLHKDPSWIESACWDSFSDDDFKRFQRCLFEPEYLTSGLRGHANLYQSTTLYPEGLFDEEAVKRLMRQLQSGCGEVLRIKGFLKGQDGSMWFVNCSPGAEYITGAPSARTAKVSIIGRGLLRSKMQDILRG